MRKPVSIVACGLALGLALLVTPIQAGPQIRGPLPTPRGSTVKPGGGYSNWIAAAEAVIELVKLVEKTTQHDTPTVVKARLRQTIGEQKLQVSKTNLDVNMDKSTSNWRGSVRVLMDVPCEITWTMDLSQINPSHLRLDAGRRMLHVKAPPIHVESVSPIIEKMEFRSEFGWGRSRYVDVKTVQSLEAALRSSCRSEARSRAEKEADSVRKQGQAALQEFLRKVFKGAGVDLEVIVE
jgi:hypothetical protein